MLVRVLDWVGLSDSGEEDEAMAANRPIDTRGVWLSSV